MHGIKRIEYGEDNRVIGVEFYEDTSENEYARALWELGKPKLVPIMSDEKPKQAIPNPLEKDYQYP